MFCFKTKLGYIRTSLTAYKEIQVRKIYGTLHVCYASSKDVHNGTRDGTLIANSGRKSERGLHRFECETTATPDCLVDIPGSLRTNSNTGVQGLLLCRILKNALFCRIVSRKLTTKPLKMREKVRIIVQMLGRLNNRQRFSSLNWNFGDSQGSLTGRGSKQMSDILITISKYHEV